MAAKALIGATLTFVPIDRRLIRSDMLSAPERSWIDAYHATCRDNIGPRLSQTARLWLRDATAPCPKGDILM